MNYEGLDYIDVDSQFKDRDRLQSIIINAFPPHERPEGDFFSVSGEFDEIKITAVYDESDLIGFFSYYIFEKQMFLSYFAIDESCRGKGYGSRILQCIKYFSKEVYKKSVFLCVEDLDKTKENYDQREKRVKFYQRFGIDLTGVSYTYKGEKYLILAEEPGQGKEYWEEQTRILIEFENRMEEKIKALMQRQ